MREEKADQASDQDVISKSVQQLDEPPAEGAADNKATRGRIGLAALGVTSRLRSRSRHSHVTNQGQVKTPENDFNALSPSHPGPEEAMGIAPEGKASPVSSQGSAFGSPTYGVVVSDNPLSPVTLIPATDTLSTRPTKGGIAYPFSLKVDGSQGRDVNASTTTLQSLNITTPSAVEATDKDKQIGTQSQYITDPPVVNAAENDEVPGDLVAATNETQEFDAPNAGLSSSVPTQHANDGVQKVEKVAIPFVEKFESTQEDLSTITDGNKTT